LALTTPPRAENVKQKITKYMSEREVTNRLSFFICCVSAFSEHFHISKRQAYRYLLTFKGMQFLYDCYEGAHTQSIEDAVADLTIICQRHGGALYD
jgi:hypothetical protein